MPPVSPAVWMITVLGSGTEVLLHDAARALHVEGDLRTSRLLFDQAFQQAERTGDGPSMARAAVGLGGLWVHEHRTTAGAAEVCERLRRSLPLVASDPVLTMQVRARLAGEADYRTGRCDEVLAIVEEARHLADPPTLAAALSMAHHCVLGPEHAALRTALAEEMIETATRAGLPNDLLVALLWRTVDGFLDGDPHSERRLVELRAAAGNRDHLAVGYVVRAMEVMLHTRAGRFAEAETLAAECAAHGHAAGDADATGWHGGQLVALRWFQGRPDELVGSLRELAHSPTLSAVDNSFFAALAVAAASAGEFREATGALARLGGAELAGLARSSSWLATMYGVVEAANLLADRETAARAYRLLLPYAHLPMIASLAVTCFGSTEHALGVAALTVGDPVTACGHLHAAVAANQRLGHWPAATLSRLRLGEALAALGDPRGEAETATARRDAAALGMRLPGPAADADRVRCLRVGRHWRIERGDRSAVVDNSVGMAHLAVLLANPGQEISALDLAAGLASGLGALVGPAQPVLDELAIADYRSRLTGLADEHTADAVVESEWLRAELAAATGLHGRVRAFTGDPERARIAVGKAIRRAVARVAEFEPELGAHLQATVHTGSRCSYRP
ncbi:hypothetical protein F4553_006219 [Allocatelliglobosispora scoriae]|uniref:LuxR family transcriptional regulator n=1 Tax=Allocatelliglobosispora scoriae TaxID=643052 RepID=A0A841BYN9_9ACTN|nr:hypothetical protein [Allocatelliglobosispora scoriae]MBB5872785.1 hypothetical protein [Allocatelliglobosispora scoriae]